ncbi:ARID DNA-binding domain-containing protein [Tanacetum coccineum]
MVAKHNKYLKAYFDSIDPKEECSLIKGLEELKWDKNEVQDYLDEDYISMNGTLYATNVNSFPRFIFFLNLIKKDSIVYKNWEVLRRRFLDMIKWFYLVFLNQDMLEHLPPVIGDVEIDLLGLYKMIDSMGGYLSVTLKNKWKEVVVIHGLTEAHKDELKSCYKRTIEMVKCYYDTTMKPWFREEPVKTKMVEDGRDYAKKENPQGCDGLEVGIEKTCQGNKTRFGVNLEDNKTTTVNNEEYQEDSASTSKMEFKGKDIEALLLSLLNLLLDVQSVVDNNSIARLRRALSLSRGEKRVREMENFDKFVQPAIPKFDGHFDHWSLLMENFLRSKEMWGLVEWYEY